MTQKQSVVIIGGGPAGLTAAWELVKDGGSEQYDVTVLEATREFGGISRTVKHDGNRMDIGGHRFFSKDDRIMDWWKDVLPLQGAPSYDDKKLHREHDMEPGGPDPEIEDKVMLKRHRVSRIYWNRHFLDYPISLSANTLKAMGFKLTMVAGFSYLKSMVHKLPETNLENFYINRFGRKLYSMFFEGYTEKLWGRHPSEISADWGAQRVKGLSIMGVLKNAFQKLLPKKRDNSEVETSLIEEFWYPKLGPGQLWETVESNCEAAGVKVITDANVVEIRQKDGKIASVVYEDSEGNRTEMAADDFISSMPVKDLVNAVDASDQPAPKDNYYYNSSLAHCVYYGASTLPQCERHLHGEIVSFGVLCLLTYDGQLEERDRIMQFNKSVGLPVTLDELEIKCKNCTKCDLCEGLSLIHI